MGERAIVNGHHDTQVFQDIIDKFIDKFVLCQGCSLPEIDMVVKKGQVVATCKACGWSGALDNDHRLASYIVKHPRTAVSASMQRRVRNRERTGRRLAWRRGKIPLTTMAKMTTVERVQEVTMMISQ